MTHLPPFDRGRSRPAQNAALEHIADVQLAADRLHVERPALVGERRVAGDHGGIADSSADGNLVRLPPVLFQPIASDDVAASVADVALAPPHNGIVEIAGPERAPFNKIVARYLKAVGDPREVVSDPEARYWGGRVDEHSLVPLGEARLGRIDFDEWFRRSRAAA